MKIAILGYGVEGRASCDYWSQDTQNIITIHDRHTIEAPEGVATVMGEDAFNDLSGYDLIVRSPGIAPRSLGRTGSTPITSVTKEFFTKCPCPIIGVTGTKGKGTTASIIHSILGEAGRKTWLVGNIGVPALDILSRVSPDDIVVYELSSFQLWDMEQSPQTAVVLMIEPDHLDVHSSYEDYIDAKGNIAAHQTAHDTAIYFSKNKASVSIAERSAGRRIPYPDSLFVHYTNGYFYSGEQMICSVSHLKLPGNHNIDNACAAITAALLYVDDAEAIARGLETFSGLPHRLKIVESIAGVSFYDDSIATTPGSAIAAIRSFAAPKVLILGGSDKGAQFDTLYDAIEIGTIRHIVTIGSTAARISRELKERGFTSITELGIQTTMDEVVQKAFTIARPDDIVIMSPACASFDMFKSYADRGEQFVHAVRKLRRIHNSSR